jgi:hypothetical protein
MLSFSVHFNPITIICMMILLLFVSNYFSIYYQLTHYFYCSSLDIYLLEIEKFVLNF